MTNINENIENIQNYSMTSNETELYDGDSEYFADIINSINTPASEIDANTNINNEYDNSSDTFHDDFNQYIFPEPCEVNPTTGWPMVDGPGGVDTGGYYYGEDPDTH